MEQRGDITISLRNMVRINKKLYYKPVYGNTFDNLGEIDKLFERNITPSLRKKN